MNISELLLVLATLLFSSRDHKSRKISFQGWKIMYKNSKTSKNYLSVIWAYMPGMTRIVCNLSSFHLFVTTHIFITFNHLCTLWRFPLIPANKYPAVLGFWIEACRQKSDCITGFFLLTSTQQELCVHLASDEVSPKVCMGRQKWKNAKETQDASPLLGHTCGPFSRLYMHCYTTIQIHLYWKPLKDSPDRMLDSQVG